MVNKELSAIITGGSRGIGRAISQRLAEDGYHTVINFHSNVEEAEFTLKSIVEKGGSAELCQFDVCDRKAVISSLENLLARLKVQILVLCAGIRNDEALIFMNEEQWDKVLDTNLASFFSVVKPVVKHMLLNRCGRIIAISSTSGESGLHGQVNYSAAKAGVLGAIKALALECAKRNVLVNAITPGFIDTDLLSGINPQEIAGKIPMNRLGKASEVASVTSFLASSEASYITGQTIRVNGGIYM